MPLPRFRRRSTPTTSRTSYDPVRSHAFLTRKDVGSTTLSVAANGKAYVTVHFAQADGSFKPVNLWCETIEAGLMAIMATDDNEDIL